VDGNAISSIGGWRVHLMWMGMPFLV